MDMLQSTVRSIMEVGVVVPSSKLQKHAIINSISMCNEIPNCPVRIKQSYFHNPIFQKHAPPNVAFAYVTTNNIVGPNKLYPNVQN